MTVTTLKQISPTPWTRQITMRWRPEVRFLESRVELLRLLENDGRLRSFRISETEITVRVTAHSELVLSFDRVELRVLSPLEVMETPLSAVKSAIDVIRPTAIQTIGAAFAHVVELAGDYDELRQSAAHGLYPWWPAPLTDFALLVDGTGRDRVTAYKCEFGIIDKADTIPRVSRMSSTRTAGPQLPGAGIHIEGLRIPEVALFADSNWARPIPEPSMPDSAWEYFSNFVDSVTADATDLVVGLHRAVSNVPNKRSEQSASR